jgi:hypothetical protein
MKSLIIAANLTLGAASLARADGPTDIRCYPLAEIKSFVDEAGGKLVDLTPEQFAFARGVFVATPPISTELPPGDHAMMGLVDGRAGILFIDGDNACDAGVLPPALAEMIRDVATGKVNHVGGGT